MRLHRSRPAGSHGGELASWRAGGPVRPWTPAEAPRAWRARVPACRIDWEAGGSAKWRQLVDDGKKVAGAWVRMYPAWKPKGALVRGAGRVRATGCPTTRVWDQGCTSTAHCAAQPHV